MLSTLVQNQVLSLLNWGRGGAMGVVLLLSTFILLALVHHTDLILRGMDEIAELSLDGEAAERFRQVLLDVALESVRPGGVVVYATCSPVLAETSRVVEAVRGRRDDTDLLDSFQLWPHREGTDAMYAATLRRRG